MIVNGKIVFSSNINMDLIEIIDNYLDSDFATIAGRVIEFNDHKPYFDTEEDLDLFVKKAKDFGNPIIFGELHFDNTASFDPYFKNAIWEGRFVFDKDHWFVKDEYSNNEDEAEDDQKEEWIVGIGGSELDMVDLHYYKASKDEIKKILVGLVAEDKEACDDYECGTEDPDEVEEKYDGSLYAYSNHAHSHLDFSAKTIKDMRSF